MANIPSRQTSGPYTVVVVEPILRGQLVEGRSGGCGVAAAASVKVLGVALQDATNADPQAGAPTGTVVLAYADAYVTVAKIVKAKVTYSAAATFGDKLVCTANGQVAPAGATPDARSIVGICMEPAGVALGAKGYAFIS